MSERGDPGAGTRRTGVTRAPSGLSDPGRDPVAWEAAVGSILEASAPELERRARAANPVLVLARWTRPVLSAAAAVALLATTAILAGRSGDDPVAARPTAVAEALVPDDVASWLLSGEVESVEALVQALEGGR